MSTRPTAAANKRVRFNPFVTYLGDEPDHPPEMEDSLRMDSSHSMMMMTGKRHSSANKRRSMDLNEAIGGAEKHFGNMTLATGGDGSSIGFGFGGFGSSGSSDLLDLSSESVLEVEGEDDADDDDDVSDRSYHDPLSLLYEDKFGSLNFSFGGNQSDSSFPTLSSQLPAAIESEPSVTTNTERHRPTADTQLAVGTAA